LLPNEWVAKQLGPDYGTDYLVEVFKDKMSTGNTFFVQLKGSERKQKQDGFALSIEVNHLKYWQTFTSPVLLVAINIQNSKCWGIWANSILDSHQIKKGQKSVSLTFTKQHIIDKEFFQSLQDVIKKDLVSKTNITAICDMAFSETVHVKILQGLNFFMAIKSPLTIISCPRIFKLFINSKRKGIGCCSR
jgi:hypothetical protein